jgi:hypothetical protein
MLGRQRLHPGIEYLAFAGGADGRRLERILGSDKTPAEERARAAAERDALAADRAALTERIIGRLLAEIADPGVPFDPALRRPDACDFCPYTAMCGR